jgi:hypothetical protein
MLCIFKREEDKLKCINCGFWIITDVEESKLHKVCGKKEEEIKKENIQYPSIPQMAKNLATAMTTYALDGFKNASDEEQERRLSICKKCPFYDELQNRCKACGCNSSLKTRIASSTCPQNFW